eukprot:7421949-Pyramimonas_sp.AAC.1
MRCGRHHAQVPLYTEHGLPAGDGFADFAIKIRSVMEMDAFLHRCPTVAMLNYIDDTAIGNASS